MAEGERFRSEGARGIARFLSEHQHPEAGFDVSREADPGSGRLLITCLGCGESIAYRAVDAGEMAAVSAIGRANGDAGSPARPGVPPAQDARPGRGGSRAGGLRPSNALAAVLIVAGIAFLAFGLVRSTSEEGGGEPPEEPAATLPSVPTQTQPPEPSEPPPEASVAPKLDRRVIEGLFAIGVPRGWRARREGSGLEIESAGSVAKVKVLLERGERGLLFLARGAAAILSDETGGARVKRAGRVRIGGVRGLRLTSDDGRGLVAAIVLTDGGYSYLLLTSVDRGASARVASEAQAATRSFRAR